MRGREREGNQDEPIIAIEVLSASVDSSCLPARLPSQILHLNCVQILHLAFLYLFFLRLFLLVISLPFP